LAVYIVGGGDNKDLEQIEEASQKFNVEVYFLGQVDNSEIPALLNRFKYFCLPSAYEGNPKSLIESMSCGTLVFCSDCDGNREIVEHGYNGFLHRSVDDLVRNLSLASHSAETSQKIASNARKTAEARFSFDYVGARFAGELVDS